MSAPKDPPGSLGLPLIGDKSYDFYKSPVNFFEKYSKHHKSRIFQTRFLMKPTVFVGSYQGVRDVLADTDCTELGYKTFLGQIFGDNILFSNGKTAERLREALCQLFTDDCILVYQDIINRIVQKNFDSLDISEPVCMYSLFKKTVTEICLSLFLGIDFEEKKDLWDTISSLTTTHWHGIISVPLSIKLPGFGNQSTFSKALEAKSELLKVIEERRSNNNTDISKRLQDELDEQSINNHLLLFTCALIPKAISSLLISFLVQTGQQDKLSWQKTCLLDVEFLEFLLQEVQRLYPPFLGGRREVVKSFIVDGFTIPAGHSIVYLTFAAHQDPSIFENSQQFYPGRWKNRKESHRLFSFGGDSRCCVGDRLVWAIVKTVLNELLHEYEWSLVKDQDLTYKWLPVSRPKENILFHLRPRE